MRRYILSCLLLLCFVAATAQNGTREKIGFTVAEKKSMTSEESGFIAKTVACMEVCLHDRHEFFPDENGMKYLKSYEEYNEEFADAKLKKHTPVTGRIELDFSPGGEYTFTLRHFNEQGANDKTGVTSLPSAFLAEDRMSDLVAYELVNQVFGLSGGAMEEYNGLKAKKDRLLADQKAKKDKQIKLAQDQERREYNRYTAMSFLPPVNQLSSNTPQGRAAGMAILSSYGISVAAFTVSTLCYYDRKRNYNNQNADLSEADKARIHYKNQMDFCRGVQIASAALFVGTYIYGVANSLSCRSTYRKDKGLTLSPAAYENGAGMAFVYRF